jgi:hypothetical protein
METRWFTAALIPRHPNLKIHPNLSNPRNLGNLRTILFVRVPP